MAVMTSTGFRTALLGGRGFASIFNNGAINVYTGPQPPTSDYPATGFPLGRITANGGSWAHGSPANGLKFIQNRQFMLNDPAQNWVFAGSYEGTAGWFRLVANPEDPGTMSTTAPRIDGAVGLADSTGDAQLYLPALEINAATSIAVPSWWYAMPPL